MTTFLPYPDLEQCAEVMHIEDLDLALKTVYDILAYSSKPHVGLWRNGRYFAKNHLLKYAYFCNKHWQIKKGIDRSLIKGVIRNIPVPLIADNSWYSQIIGLANRPMPGRETLGLECEISWNSRVHKSHQAELFRRRRHYYHIYFSGSASPVIYGGIRIKLTG